VKTEETTQIDSFALNSEEAVLLHNVGGLHPYATHRFRYDDHELFWGCYHETLDRAVECFRTRCKGNPACHKEG
jgi:hypothetical protein